MFNYNDTVTFTRYSNFVVQNWQSGPAEIFSIASPAFLQVAVSGITPGTLYIYGTDDSDVGIGELFTFTASASLLSTNKFKTVAGLTPSWSSFTINVTAADEQGEPVRRSTSYGPFLCSVTELHTFQREGVIDRPGYVKGSFWRIAVLDFQPVYGDYVTTLKGVTGWIGDIYPVMMPNLPHGWEFLVTENAAT